ncbi:ATP-dependent 3'-5' DNA helicase [Sporobolomyces salmoneus]|uniref:ATP-dependent 3'-5' DNA helicase n=1 Tax=Sporobolomyces salmoneus TaxID=183962 RepID=UPI00317CC7F5
MKGGSQHISGKSDRTSRISGGGLLGSQPHPQPRSSEASSSSSVVPLFRSAPDDLDDLEDEEGDDFEPVASTSAAVEPVMFNGQKSTAPPRAKLSNLPPPPKKKPKTTAAAAAAQGKREYIEGEKEITTGTTAKGKGKGRATTKKGKENMEKLLTAKNVQFPPHFLKLEKTFKALNTVYTFCSTRKSMATTFEVLKGSVENLLKRPLEMHDIAQIKSLLPTLISFAYIDSEHLRVHSSSAPDGEVMTEAERKALKREQRQRELDEAYRAGGQGERAKESVDEYGRKKAGETVLLFGFNDGELKSENGVGKVITRRFQRRPKKKTDSKEGDEGTGESTATPPPAQPVQTDSPKFSTAQMTALIAKRNNKFHSAVSDLIVACASHNPPLDPVELLLEATAEHLPVHPDELVNEDDIREKGVREKQEELGFYERNPDHRKSIATIIEEITSSENDWYEGQIVDDGHRTFEAREAVYGSLDHPVSEALASALHNTKNIDASRLYSHQAKAINALHAGKNVIISTSTSSGKSLVYQLPVVQALEQDIESTALYVFPTKALAQDQKRALGELVAGVEGLEDVKVATFDGDTPRDDRDFIREYANVIFTNPDMLHLTVLPQEERWRRFFCNLKFVVVDELHIYSGLFGCHVSFVMRRLRRICRALGNETVQFVSCSATISNPAQHMQTIFGVEDIELIDEDGSPCGQKEYLVWNPPYIDENDLKQGRISTIQETSRIFRFLMQRGIRVIVFCRVRAQCEIMIRQVKQDLMLEGRSDMAGRVMSYRSGYSAQDRRKIEQEMFSGQLLGVIATTALELGIDIGSLDAVLSVGFPYTLPGLRQQAGRAGRRNKDSLAMLICDPFPLDQHYARNPDLIFTSPFQELQLDLENPIVLEAHIQCAADEVPIHPPEDELFFGDKLATICRDRLVPDDDGFYHCHPRYKPYPAKTVPIRNTEDESYSVVDITGGRNVVIEEVEMSRAIFTTYEGAVYMHMGRTFLVKEVNHDRKLAKIQEATIEWRTRQRDFTNIDPLEALSIREVKGAAATASYGLVQLTSIVFGYFKVDKRNNILDTVDISSPPFIRTSHGLWIDVPKSALEILLLKNFHPAGSIHAAEHALMSLTPIVAMCAEGDVRTECKMPEKELANVPSSRKRPARLILYDSAGKSGGICAKAFDHVSLLVTQAADTIKNCKCSEGCPSCVASLLCSGANTIVSKIGALIVLESILGRPIDLDSIPLQSVAKGITPGGTVDLAAAGVHPDLIKAANERANGQPVEVERFQQMQNVAEEEEEDEAMLLERERALAELMGGAPLKELPGSVGASEGTEGRELYSLKKTGGFM